MPSMPCTPCPCPQSPCHPIISHPKPCPAVMGSTAVPRAPPYYAPYPVHPPFPSPGSLSSSISPQAVCCSDKQHCCPQGTTCDLAHSTCTSLGASAPLAALPTGKTPREQPPPALSRGGDASPDCPLSPARDVKCDGRTSCPDGNTCCRLISGAWGCCPLEEVWGGPLCPPGQADVPCPPGWDKGIYPLSPWVG